MEHNLCDRKTSLTEISGGALWTSVVLSAQEQPKCPRGDGSPLLQKDRSVPNEAASYLNHQQRIALLKIQYQLQ